MEGVMMKNKETGMRWQSESRIMRLKLMTKEYKGLITGKDMAEDSTGTRCIEFY